MTIMSAFAAAYIVLISRWEGASAPSVLISAIDCLIFAWILICAAVAVRVMWREIKEEEN